MKLSNFETPQISFRLQKYKTVRKPQNKFYCYITYFDKNPHAGLPSGCLTCGINDHTFSESFLFESAETEQSVCIRLMAAESLEEHHRILGIAGFEDILLERSG